jgi:hypothetical protein
MITKGRVCPQYIIFVFNKKLKENRWKKNMHTALSSNRFYCPFRVDFCWNLLNLPYKCSLIAKFNQFCKFDEELPLLEIIDYYYFTLFFQVPHLDNAWRPSGCRDVSVLLPCNFTPLLVGHITHVFGNFWRFSLIFCMFNSSIDQVWSTSINHHHQECLYQDDVCLTFNHIHKSWRTYIQR